jgi:hypothetical protein
MVVTESKELRAKVTRNSKKRRSAKSGRAKQLRKLQKTGEQASLSSMKSEQRHGLRFVGCPTGTVTGDTDATEEGPALFRPDSCANHRYAPIPLTTEHGEKNLTGLNIVQMAH